MMIYVSRDFSAVVLLTVFCATLGAQEPFPPATAAEQGLPPGACEQLAEHVRTLVEVEDAVGAELHVIKDRRTVLHVVYGWADREQKRRLKPDSIYCVRSMTKPLVGTAIQMLIDDGKLSLAERVSDILEEFDKAGLRDITIQHLLTHTSGLPMTAINRTLQDYEGIRAVAADAADAGVDFEPGTGFQYSDAGSDTLGAIVEAVSGMKVDEFIRARIIKPVGMADTITVLKADSPVDRIPSAYSGGAGSWERHWQSSDSLMFPFFLSSQSLYSTTSDYARFVSLWMDDGHVGDRRLLSKAAITRALAPGRAIHGYPTDFGKLRRTYGQQWMVHHENDSTHPVIFGHDGSDGTHVWAWPDRDLVVLFFTQSRGTLAGVQLEPVLDRLLIQGDVAGFVRDAAADRAARKSLQRYTGIYWDEDVESAYYQISFDNNRLLFERPGRARAVATPTGEEGEFKVGRSMKLRFETDSTPSAAMRMTTGRTERQVRHTPQPHLPTVDDIIAKVSEAHRIGALGDAGVIRLSGTITAGPLGFSGTIENWFDRRRSRIEVKMGSRFDVVVTNGDEVAGTGADGTFRRLGGAAREQQVCSHPAVIRGNWRQGYSEIEVLKRLVKAKRLLVRTRTGNLPGAMLVVDESTSHVVAEKRFDYLPGVGFVGVETTYSDFRDVAGVMLPFRSESQYANPLIGKVTVEFTDSERGLAAGDLFALPPE